ncbi:MAG TPA: ferrochelatase [Streptosporangiaceae bacterium]|nr:ferrochelatase [Streptosporangiaceae bacterium]
MPRDTAFLLVSFGGPESPDDVMPFLRHVTARRGVPDDRLAKVAEHYYLFGGVSPINGQCRDLLDALAKDFAASGMDLPLYWGNRNWTPFLTDTMRAMAADGIKRAIAFATSAYSSFSSCRQYLDDIDRARAVVLAGEGAAVPPATAPEVIKIPPYYRHPAFIASFADSVSRAIGTLPADLADRAELIFTAHSIPDSMAATSGPAGVGGAYPAQLAEAAALVAASAGRTSWRMAYQSRSGPPSVPWLRPDVNDCLRDAARAGAPAVVVVPIGFVSDHMEVIYDLDVEAARTAGELGLPMARAATPGTGARFVAMISALVRDYAAGVAGEAARALGRDAGSLCGELCCGSGEDRSARWMPTTC